MNMQEIVYRAVRPSDVPTKSVPNMSQIVDDIIYGKMGPGIISLGR